MFILVSINTEKEKDYSLFTFEKYKNINGQSKQSSLNVFASVVSYLSTVEWANVCVFFGSYILERRKHAEWVMRKRGWMKLKRSLLSLVSEIYMHKKLPYEFLLRMCECLISKSEAG